MRDLRAQQAAMLVNDEQRQVLSLRDAWHISRARTLPLQEVAGVNRVAHCQLMGARLERRLSPLIQQHPDAGRSACSDQGECERKPPPDTDQPHVAILRVRTAATSTYPVQIP